MPVTELAPDTSFYAVGDIHGRLDLLQTLLSQLDDDCPVVFVGDYVDRGDYSAQVLRQLRHLTDTSDGRVVCLLGNHEDMLLRFLEAPERAGRLWLTNGGLQTLASFGVGAIPMLPTGDDAARAATQLRAAMGEEFLTWLANLPLTWASGNVTVVHAALDPRCPTGKQQRKTCLWGHPQFRKQSRRDGQWVVHGHTIVDEPRISGGVISIDTGAFATDHLTAARISKGGVHFTST